MVAFKFAVTYLLSTRSVPEGTVDTWEVLTVRNTVNKRSPMNTCRDICIGARCRDGIFKGLLEDLKDYFCVTVQNHDFSGLNVVLSILFLCAFVTLTYYFLQKITTRLQATYEKTRSSSVFVRIYSRKTESTFLRGTSCVSPWMDIVRIYYKTTFSSCLF